MHRITPLTMASARPAVASDCSAGPSSFTIFPLESKPTGIPEERLKRVFLVRHAQGEWLQ
jgi:hypothetical protein